MDIQKHLTEKFDLSVIGTPLTMLLIPPIRLVEFFELLNACTSILLFDDTTFCATMKRIQKRFIVFDSLYEQLTSFFSHYFKSGLDKAISRFVWIFYLYLIKLTDTSDFEILYLVYTAWLDFVWKNAPSTMKDYGYSEDEVFMFMQVAESDLSPDYRVKVTDTFNDLFQNSLSEVLSEPTNLTKLEEHYESLLYQNEAESCNDFDGRVFLSSHDLVGPVNRMISAPVYQLNPRTGESITPSNEIILSPLRSPRSRERPKNIVHATVLAVQLLNQRLKDELLIPDDELKRFFSGCSVDQTEAIVSRLDTLVRQVPFENMLPTAEATYRRELTKKIYFNVLRDMLLGEEKRLKEQNFTVLLTNENFHRSHIICSIETVLFAYNMRDLISFPDLLQNFNLQAFELSIIIESFVQHAAWFSSAFRRHFRYVEERLLDSLTWTHDSVLYPKIAEAEEHIQPPPEPGSITPVAKKKQRMFAVYQGEQKAQSGKGAVAINYFFRKVYLLVSQRIQELCVAFSDHITREKVESIWRVVYHILSTRRDLMLNRHLDQIIMSSMYAICKVGKMGISFRHIISNYRYICEGTRGMSPVDIGKILYKVQLEHEGETGDIVRFYNHIYIPAVKEFILVHQASNVPKMPYNQANSLTSPQRQRVSNNLWVSPMRGSRRGSLPNAPTTTTMELISSHGAIHHAGATMTPRTKELYSFGENFVVKSPSSKRSAKRSLDFSSDGGSTSPVFGGPRKFQRIQHDTKKAIVNENSQGSEVDEESIASMNSQSSNDEDTNGK
jgi:hypothetical protein